MSEFMKQTAPDVKIILDTSMTILRQFAWFANQYYNNNKDDEVLQKVNANYDMYEILFREVILNLFSITDGNVKQYDIKIKKPFVEYLKGYLKDNNMLKYCLDNKYLIVEATNRLIDKTILHTMFDKVGDTVECSEN